MKNIQYVNFDATILQRGLIGEFNRILVDAPYSVTDVINKNLEMKPFRTKKDVKNLVDTQRQILESREKYPKEGGILVYSTCLLLEEKNEENVEFMENRLHLKRKNIEFYGDKSEFIKLMPFQKGMQGFSIPESVEG